MGVRLTRHLGLKALALLLALLLWFLVLAEQKGEGVVRVPFEDYKIPTGLVLMNEPVGAVAVRVRGPQTLVAALGPDEITLPALSPLREGENVVELSPQTVRVPRGLDVLQVSPARVRVVLEAEAEREIPVTPRMGGRPPRGYVVRRAVAEPGRVRIVGPRSAVQRLARAFTEPISLDGRTGSFSVRVPLAPPAGRVRFVQQGPIAVQIEVAKRRS